ncbi:MAG: hypothetical protein EBU49_07425 [Proteobacteria bacterium]|nr:hypothetical protein [Pseudomonadota bacterium]
MIPIEVSRMRVFLVFFYLAAVVGCKASVNKTQLASGFQDPDAANENEMERLPPVITDPQKIKRLATGLAERGVPEDVIQAVLRELTSERVSRKKFASKISDPVTIPNPDQSPVPLFTTEPGVLANIPEVSPIPVFDSVGGNPPPLESPTSPERNMAWYSLSAGLKSILETYNITPEQFQQLCV